MVRADSTRRTGSSVITAASSASSGRSAGSTRRMRFWSSVSAAPSFAGSSTGMAGGFSCCVSGFAGVCGDISSAPLGVSGMAARMGRSFCGNRCR